MARLVQELDRILRGEATRPDQLRDVSIDISTRGLSLVIVLLGMIYGLCMGFYSLFRGLDGTQVAASYWQIIASAVKVPALFFLTLLITFPSLYVFNALVGSRLTLIPVLRLLIASLAVNLAVLASLGPIVAFFSVSTPSYSFILLLNVFVFTVAGVLGLVFLLQTLNRLTHARLATSVAQAVEESPQADDDATETNDTGALQKIEGHMLGKHVKLVFACWIVLFGLVGAQMGWVLRPFVGDPELEFAWFRARDSNFFEAVWQTLVQLLTGGGA